MRTLIRFSLVVICAPLLCGAKLEITYVANEGFLLSDGTRKVLIDALFSGEDKPYGDFPSSELVTRMEQAQPPFRGLNLVLATHPHDDHFSARVVAQHLTNDKDAVFLSTSNAVEGVRRASPELAGRTRSVCPAQMNSMRTEEAAGIRVEAFWVTHGRPDFENLGYRLTFPGITALHLGDSRLDDWRSFKWDDAGIDVVFINPGAFQRSMEQGLEVAKGLMKARTVVLMHYKLGRDLEKTQQLAARLQPHFRQVIVFTKPLATRTTK